MKLVTITAAFILALPVTGRTSPILISAPNPSALTFTAQAGNTLEVSVSSAGFDGAATYQADTGTAHFGAMDFFTGQVNAGSPPFFTPLPPPPATEAFSYQSTSDADMLTAVITWDKLTAPPLPGESQLFGTALITFSSGDSTFLMDFKTGSTASIFANFPISGPCSLADLATGPPNCSVTMEVGLFEGADARVTPPPPDVPEPMSSVIALAMALFLLWGTCQVMRRQRGPSWS